jgi:type IV pilus assembly protein PilB
MHLPKFSVKWKKLKAFSKKCYHISNMVDFDDKKQQGKIDDLKKKEEEDVAKILASRYGVGYLDLSPIPINTDALRIVPEDLARETNVAIFQEVNKKIEIAVLSPNHEKTIALLQKLSNDGYLPTVFMVSKASLEKAWSRYKDLSYASESRAGTFDISDEQILILMEKIKKIADVKTEIDSLLGVKQTYKISKIMEIMLAGALSLSASDIHIEPEETFVKMRYRLDGVLVDVIELANENYNLMLSRIKLLSGLKLNITEEAQDGRFSVKIKDNDIEIRTSILPGNYNESIVMRLLNPKSIAVPLEDLGIHPRTLATLIAQIERPEGMLLITGPTGSGKTTTLYAFLKKINNSEVKIITIEDPIEYHLQGVVQTQVEEEKGYTFLSGLRSALRQDPDVIMVGEIRDKDTANTAIDAANTGHLVFSTLHANSASGAFPRLIGLGVNPKIISSAVNVAMAQRLVRKLCTFCKKEKVLSDEEKNIFEKIISGITDQTYIEGIQREKIWEPVGCDKCHAGYKGRIAICELILMTKKIEEAVVNNPSEREVKEASIEQNFLDMKQDGVIKILQGTTSLNELSRVIDLENK